MLLKKNFLYMRHRSKERRKLSYYSDLLVNKDLVKEMRLFNLSDLFIDSALKICGNDVAAFTEFVESVNALVTKLGFNCVMTSSIAVEDVPEALKKYL